MEGIEKMEGISSTSSIYITVLTFYLDCCTVYDDSPNSNIFTHRSNNKTTQTGMTVAMMRLIIQMLLMIKSNRAQFNGTEKGQFSVG